MGLLLATVAFCVVYFGLAQPVPLVIGLPRASAFSVLSSQGFTPAAVYATSDAVPAGIVIRQPGAGGRSWRGERVLVWVSFGKNPPVLASP
jgi:beta-lactam-binding protein with PASTA domain